MSKLIIQSKHFYIFLFVVGDKKKKAQLSVRVFYLND